LVVPVFPPVRLLVVVPVLVVGREFDVLVVVVPPPLPVLVVVVPPLVEPVVVVLLVDVELVVVTAPFELALRMLALPLFELSDEQLPPIKAIAKRADSVSVFFIKISPVY